MTPQSVWPQTITRGTRRTPTAYSMVAETPPIASEYGGTTLPITRQMNNSPGLVWSVGTDHARVRAATELATSWFSTTTIVFTSSSSSLRPIPFHARRDFGAFLGRH